METRMATFEKMGQDMEIRGFAKGKTNYWIFIKSVKSEVKQ